MSKFPTDLWDALNGKKGDLDIYLEVHNEQEVRDHILALLEHKGATSLRDEFAGKAMQGILAGDHPITHQIDAEQVIAEVAYVTADAMLAARSK